MTLELKRDADFLKRRTEFLNHKREESSSGKDFFFKKKIAIFAPKEGDVTVRFLDGTWPGALHYAYDIYVHYQIGPNKGNFLCIEKMPELAHKNGIKSKTCAICAMHKDTLAKNDTEGAKAFNVQRRCLSYVINRDEEAAGPLVWSMPYQKITQALITLANNKRTGEFLLIEDPVTGNDVSFTKKGSKLQTQYDALKIEPMTSPLSDKDDLAKKWIDFTQKNPIPDLLEFKDEDYVKAVLAGTAEATAETPSGEEDNKPITSVATKKEEKAAEAPKQETPKQEAPKQEAKSPEKPSSNGKPTKQELNAMSREQLLEIVEKFNIEIDVKEYPTESELAMALGIELAL